MNYFWFKACVRCNGDIFLDAFGDKTCLQCGHIYFQFTPRTLSTLVENMDLTINPRPLNRVVVPEGSVD